MYKIVIIGLLALLAAGCGKSTDVQVVKGDTGATGSTGSQGNVGPGGGPGANGAPGQDATPVVAIQLCPSSFIPSYPNVFPESALCVGNNLYGVYSAHGGFLALLPPGVYSSNGINASCTFTVSAGCVVN